MECVGASRWWMFLPSRSRLIRQWFHPTGCPFDVRATPDIIILGASNDTALVQATRIAGRYNHLGIRR